jgi:hypothetical protein
MHPNEALARREIELIEAGELDVLEELYTADLVVHYPGRNPLSGSYPVHEFLARFEARWATAPSHGSCATRSVAIITPYSFSGSPPRHVDAPIRGTQSLYSACGRAGSPSAGFTLTINTPWMTS